MKILYVTDLHGNILKYDRIFNIVKELNIDMVINGGDLYPKINLRKQDEFITSYLDSYLNRFERLNIPYLLIPGNDDLKTYDGLLEDVCNQYKNIFLVQNKKIELEGYEFIGFDLVADYPFRLKDRCRRDSDFFTYPRQFGSGLLSTPIGFDDIKNWFIYAEGLPTISEELEKLPKPININKTIYIIHMPPSGLDLDVCSNYEKVGSNSVLKFLKKYQPLLSLHGHIHESYYMSDKWKNYIGKTICIQPGQLDSLNYVIINLDTMKIEFTEDILIAQ